METSIISPDFENKLIFVEKMRKLSDEMEEYIMREEVEKAKEKLDGFNSNSVNRVEVIDENGRSYVNWDDRNKVELSYQDEGRTLKVFITKK